MIPIPGDVQIWLALGYNDMRLGMPELARKVQHGLSRAEAFARTQKRDYVRILPTLSGYGLAVTARPVPSRRYRGIPIRRLDTSTQRVHKTADLLKPVTELRGKNGSL